MQCQLTKRKESSLNLEVNIVELCSIRNTYIFNKQSAPEIMRCITRID
jgi:hypothetical protein